MVVRRKISSWIGVVNIDMFNLRIPVFDTDEARLKVFARKGVQTYGADEPIHGMACMDKASDGARILSLVITPEASVGVWAHEASHLTDFIFEMFGLPTGLKNTETRAYMTGHITDQICEIMHRYNLKRSKEADIASP